MLINLFFRIYLAYPNAKTNNDSWPVIHLSDEEINSEKDEHIFFYKLIDWLYSKCKNNEIMFIIISPDTLEGYAEILNKYKNLLHITPGMAEAIHKHYVKFSKYIDAELKADDIDWPDNVVLKENYESYPHISEHYLNYIPSEYLVNMVQYNKIAYWKQFQFMVYDFFKEILQVMTYRFNSKQVYRKDLIFLHSIYDEGPSIKIAQYIYQHQELLKEIHKVIFEDYGLTSKFYPFNITDYVSMNSSKGYSSAGLIKYNHYLDQYIKSTDYKIEMD